MPYNKHIHIDVCNVPCIMGYIALELWPPKEFYDSFGIINYIANKLLTLIINFNFWSHDSMTNSNFFQKT